MKLLSFPCEMCGECCRRIGVAGLLLEFQVDDGTCMHLTGDNCCDIYASRPIFCRVDEMYDQFFASEMTREAFYATNKELCVEFRQS
jgi:Fe-S-cluster containining protein